MLPVCRGLLGQSREPPPFLLLAVPPRLIFSDTQLCNRPQLLRARTIHKCVPIIHSQITVITQTYGGQRALTLLASSAPCHVWCVTEGILYIGIINILYKHCNVLYNRPIDWLIHYSTVLYKHPNVLYNRPIDWLTHYSTVLYKHCNVLYNRPID